MRETIKENSGAIKFTQIILYFLGLTKRHRMLWLICILLMSADIVLNVGLAWINEEFLYLIEIGNAEKMFNLIMISLMVTIILMTCFILGSYLEKLLKLVVTNTLMIKLYNKVNLVPFNMMQKRHSSDWTSRIISDSAIFSGVVTNSVFNIVYNVITLVTAFFYLSTINFYLALLVLSTGPITFAVGRIFDKKLRVISKEIQIIASENRGKLQEMFTGMMNIRAFGSEKSFYQDFYKGKYNQYQLSVKNAFYKDGMWAVINFVNAFVVLFCVSVIAWLAINGEVKVGSLMAFYILLSQVQAPFINLSGTWGNLQNSMGAAERVFDLEDLPEEKVMTKKGDSTSKHEGLELINVSFKYSNQNDYLFQNINLKIESGQKIGIVGTNGSGKSTLIKICAGLYSPSDGGVLINGTSLNENLGLARSQIAYVSQNPYIFTGTILENIKYGKLNATDKEVIAAAKLANADVFIQTLPNGYNTVLDEKGAPLSGGQIQRVALARAYIKQAPVIILDEPTSSLDSINEKSIFTSIEQVSREHTLLIVTHNLRNLHNVDKVLVVDKGKIIAQDTHFNLLENNRIYQTLYDDLISRDQKNIDHSPSTILS